jgi:antitoxin VapB
MKTAKLFKNGRSQAVRLPKEFRFEGESVYIQKVGEYVILVPEANPWSSMIKATHSFSDDFLAEREQPGLQEREDLE